MIWSGKPTTKYQGTETPEYTGIPGSKLLLASNFNGGIWTNKSQCQKTVGS